MYTRRAEVGRVRSTRFPRRISRLSFLAALVAVAIPTTLATTDRLRATPLPVTAARENEDFQKPGPVAMNPRVQAVSAGDAGRARVLSARTTSAYQTYGMDFSPYIDGQDPNFGTIITEDQLRARMQIIANNTLWVRSFGCTHGLEKTGLVAHSLGLNAAVGAWLSRDLVANDQEISNLISAANSGQVDLAIVGSEVLLRNDLTENQLVGYMNQVRQQIPANIPVATADVYGKLLEHPAIITNSDVVLPNYYPYWEGVSVNIAIATLHRQHLQVVAASQGKSVIVSETGWPSAGNTICNAVPSPTNASFYFLNFVSWARANNVSYFYFDALDETWKANHGEGPQGAHWGVWDKDGVLKPGMQDVFDGQTIPDNWTNAGIPGGPGSPSIEFTSVPPFGSFNHLFGQVLHVNTDNYKVAVYIYVSGWYNKPTWANPSTNIGLTGGWECNITTFGNDVNATQIIAFLVPATFTPPEMRGDQTLPPSLYENSVATTEIARSSTSLYIHGRVTDSNNQGLSCVTISLTGSQTATTHTITDGFYSFINLQPGGNYTVTPSHPSYTFSPSSWTFNNLGSNQTGDFVAISSTSTITLSASPIAGGTVSGAGTFATGSSRTVTATANSGYIFANWTEDGSVVSLSTSYTFTLNADRTLTAVFSSSNKGTIGLYNPATSFFYLSNSNSSAPADIKFGYGPAGAGWIPVAGDWNGDGVDTIGLYNPTSSVFFLRNSNSSAPADLVFSYGPAGAGWIPIAGDWNGDGTDTIGLYNPATSTFFLSNSNSSAPASLVFTYGPAGAGWIPIAGDWNGDGVDTIGLYNPATSTFFLSNSNSSAPAALVFGYGPAGAGWRPVTGDWNGDGVDTIGLFNPTTSTFFLRNTNSSAPADLVFSYGPAGAGWTPIVGDWDGL